VAILVGLLLLVGLAADQIRQFKRIKARVVAGS
jgi:hypothetical protein